VFDVRVILFRLLPSVFPAFCPLKKSAYLADITHVSNPQDVVPRLCRNQYVLGVASKGAPGGCYRACYSEDCSFLYSRRKEISMTCDEIKELRRLSGLSQEDFARELGISFATVNRWENGRAAPSRLALRLLEQFKKRTTRLQAS